MAEIHEAISNHYSTGYEDTRLTGGRGKLELERSRELFKRFLPPAPAKVADIGGGTGVHSFWLAELGYEVHLVDIVPLHITIAEQKNKNLEKHRLKSLSIGDARSLDFNDNSFDAVLLLGPLYHLTKMNDRNKALSEIFRILNKNGILMAAGISRFASLLDGIRGGYLNDPDFLQIVEKDLSDGQHHNFTDKPEYFMDTFFHHPDELKSELEDVGFTDISILGIEGPCWIMNNLTDLFDDESFKIKIFEIAKTLENEKSIIGASSHLMAIGKKDTSA